MEVCLTGLLLWCFHLELLWADGTFAPQQTTPAKARTPIEKEGMPSPTSSLTSASTWVPTPNLDQTDPEGTAAAMAFLYSGDTLRLSLANCTCSFEVRDVEKVSSPLPASQSYLRGAIDTLTHATNFLNMIFQTNDIRESIIKEDAEWYHALVRSIVAGDSQVYRAVLTFDVHPVSSKPQIMFQATKEKDKILLQDLSASAESLSDLTWKNEWYNFFRFQRSPLLYKRILNNDLKTLDTPKWSQGDSYVTDPSQVKWSPPFLECKNQKFLPNWMVTLASSFYGLKPDLNPEFKGVIRMDVKIQSVDINQCASGRGWFTNTHQCDLNSTQPCQDMAPIRGGYEARNVGMPVFQLGDGTAQCIPQERQGFILGRYFCLCKPGFYRANRASFPNGQSGESASQHTSQYGAVDSGNLLECKPCQEGCTTCIDDTPCLIKEDWSLRATILICQAFCMLAVFLSMLISYHFRKSKRIQASGIVLLEMILFGSLLLYFPVFILYFKPSIFRCIILRWVRMLGFAIVYGTITLKLYRILKVFLSRTAQQVPYMTSGRVLKMLALILLLVLWFLAAWTAGMLENIEKNIPLVVRSQTTRGLHFYVCNHDRWDYMMVVAETLFLFWGSFLCYATRAVPSTFHEPRYMGIALHNELIISAAFHVVRFLMVPSLHPDWTLLLFFIHTHITITMTLALLFIPKFLHAGSPLREEIATEVYEEELDMRRSGSYLDNNSTSTWNEHSLDPDDIRDELKKLYMQLEIHKTKKMTANNPHLQKKRSFRRGLGRSLLRRITEIPDSMSRQCSKEEKDRSVGAGSKNYSSSYKRRHLDSGSSSMKLKADTSSKHKMASSLKKSHSTYDHTRDVKETNLPSRHNSCKEAPLLDSLMRKKLAKKSLESSNNSLDDPEPLVYKSASAHNLLADKKTLHHKPSPLQKSLSVVSSATEKALLLTSRACFEDGRKQVQNEERRTEESTTESEVSGHAEITAIASEEAVERLRTDDTSAGTVISFLDVDSSSKDTVYIWEDVTAPSTPSESRSQKHVMYAPIRRVSLNTSDLPRKKQHVSKKMSPEPPIRQQSLALSFKRRGVAPWDSQEQTQFPIQSPQKGSKDNPTPVNVCPGEAQESPTTTEMESIRQGKDGLPLSSPVGPNQLASLVTDVCPWEVMEVPVPRKKDPPMSDSEGQKSFSEKHRQSFQISIPKTSLKSLGLVIKAFNRSRIKASIKVKKDGEGSPRKNEKDPDGKNEKAKLAAAASVSLEGPPMQQSAPKSPGESKAKIVSNQTPIGPGDEEGALPRAKKNSPSKSKHEVHPWKMAQHDLGQGRTSSTEAMASKHAGEISTGMLERTKRQQEYVCHWETTDADQKREDKTTGVSRVGSKTVDKKAEACPWEMAEDTSDIKNDIQSWKICRALPGGETVREGKGKLSDGRRKETSLRQPIPFQPQEVVCGKDVSNVIEKPFLEKDKKSPDLSKDDQRKPECVQSSTIQVRSWDTEKVGFRVNIEPCPWEVGEPPMKKKMPIEDSRASSKEDKSFLPKKKVGHCKVSICHQDSMELLEKTDVKSTATAKKSDNAENIKAAVCPWEATHIPSEKNASPEKPSTELAAKVSDLSGTVLKTSRSVEGKKVEVCPWEDMEYEDSIIKSSTKSLDQSKTSSKKPDSVPGKKIDIVPWEAQEVQIEIKPIICPQENPEAPTLKESLTKDGNVTSKEEKKRTQDMASSKTLATESNAKSVSVCPWKNAGSEDSFIKHDPKSSDVSNSISRRSDMVENKTATVSPWEAEDTEVSCNAETWALEISSIPSYNRSSRQNMGGASRRNGSLSKSPEEDRIPLSSICPWETRAIEDIASSYNAKTPHFSKVGSKKSKRTENRQTDVCPWEIQETESSTKADVDPWNLLENPLDKRASAKDRRTLEEARATPLKQTGPSKTTESICLWEDIDPNVKPEGTKVPLKESGSGESLKAEVGPWESMELKKLSVGLDGQSPGLSKASSKKSDSIESLTADVCPRESLEEEPESKVEICPGKAATVPFEKEALLQDSVGLSKGKDDERLFSSATHKNGENAFKKIEKSKSHQESVCTWQNMDFEKPFAKSTRSLDPLQNSSRESDHVDRFKAVACPGEVQNLPTSARAKICTWEATEELSARKTLRKDKIFRNEVSSPRESICPWENMELKSKSPELPKIGSKKSDSAENLRVKVCPWEIEEEEFSGKLETHSPKAAPIAVKKGASQRDVSGAPKSKMDWKRDGREITPKQIEKAHRPCELAHPQESIDEPSRKLSSKSFDQSKTGSKGGDESVRATVCPWETQEADFPNNAEVCPWDVIETPSQRETVRKDVSMISKRDVKVDSKASEETEKCNDFQESICPWENMDAGKVITTRNLTNIFSKKPDSIDSRKTEICPWEVEQLGASTQVKICPGEEPVPAIKTEKEATHTSRIETPTATVKGPQSKQEDLGGHKLLCRIPPNSIQSKGLSKGSVLLAGASAKDEHDSTMVNTDPSWEVKENSASTKKDSVDLSKSFAEGGCPWEVRDTSPRSAESKTEGKSEASDAKDTSTAKSDICPWGCD